MNRTKNPDSVIKDSEDAIRLASSLLLLIEEASSDPNDTLHEYAMGVKSGASFLVIGNREYRYSELLNLVLQTER